MEKGKTSDDFLVKFDGFKNTVISGYASVFEMIDNQNDIVEKGAFADAKPENVKLLWQHDKLKPIGIIKSIYEDSYGLKIEAELNNNTIQGKEATELVKQKAVSGLSIGFYTKDFNYNEQGVRVLKKIDLMEVSIVTFPANSSAGITDVKAMHKQTFNKSLNRLEELVHKLYQIPD